MLPMIQKSLVDSKWNFPCLRNWLKFLESWRPVDRSPSSRTDWTWVMREAGAQWCPENCRAIWRETTISGKIRE